MNSKDYPLFFSRSSKSKPREDGKKREMLKTQIKMPQFFELTEDELIVLNPYCYSDALKRLDLLDENYFLNDLDAFAKKDFEFRNEDENAKYDIGSYCFLTSVKTNENDLNLIKLESMDEYLLKQENGKKIIKSSMQFITGNEKKEILIKSKIQYSPFCDNIKNKMCVYSEFKSIKTKFNKLDEKYKKSNEKLEFEIIIQANSINKVIYSENAYLFDLQHPPIYKTNFLMDKKEGKEKEVRVYEKFLFPFRNFDDEISNLKYRRSLILLQKKIEEQTSKIDKSLLLNVNDSNISSISLFDQDSASLKNFIDPSKIQKVDNDFYDNLLTENAYKEKMSFLIKNFELKDYFEYESHPEIKKNFTKLKFYNPKEKVSDLYIIKLYYQILVLISENILSYYNAIEFIENIIFKHKKDYKKTIFSKCTDNDYPLLFNETLTRLIENYQNIQTEFSLETLESKLYTTFDSLYSDLTTKGIDFILKPSRNKNLIRIQRAIITPTYTLFTPYILDQGNRILRNFIDDPSLSMICVFKMDDYSDGKWNNRFLIEFMKFILMKGILIGSKVFKFFNFSQSQFRSMSCWLLTEPEKILPLTGDYSHINVVAKYGARISQTLTTTIRTILIPKECIEKIEDVVIKDDNGKDKYTFSDGVGQISYSLARKISDFMHFKSVPAAFQGRFLGCKGVWTTIYDSEGDFIRIRPSQLKFNVNIQDEQYFELCDYSRYIQAYLNRQIILLLSALKIRDVKFISKLRQYRSKLEDEKFALSLIHYEEWNAAFTEMHKHGVNMKNDRLIKSLVESNKTILFQDLKSKARIYIEDSAYVIGIMDEFGILEYGEAFCHIKRRNFDLILSKRATVAKCPCLHPGDIRVLNFKKYSPGNKETEKYRVFEKYENVIIFPKKGHRPHPNELSGSDLDGDNYFIFYDDDLIPDHTVEPMNYNFDNLKKKTKNKPITIKNVIKYFCEYVNLNNLGLIGDAHLANSDVDDKGALGEIPMGLAVKFSRAVDAPKTGDKVELDDKENPKKFPHFMEKKKNSYISRKVLGQLYDMTKNFIDGVQNKKNKLQTFYDNGLCLENKWELFGLIALTLYKEYFEEMTTILKKNEVKTESILLTGNSVDNEMSIFTKKKHNYDLRERVQNEMIEIFRKFHLKFEYGLSYILHLNADLNYINQELFFRNNFHVLSSACYMVSYNILEISSKRLTYLSNFEQNLYDIIAQNLTKENDDFNIECAIEYESAQFGFNLGEISSEFKSSILTNKNNNLHYIQQEIEKLKKSLDHFLIDIQRKNIPHEPEDENQSRILSFPWCLSGKILSKLKLLSLE